jgi:SanA protein
MFDYFWLKGAQKKVKKIAVIVFRSLFFRILILIFFVLFCWSNWCVYSESHDFLSSEMKDLPYQKYALVLGTSRNLGNGSPNVYFFKRINACVRLFKADKIRYVLVSGDNGEVSYNEPEAMRNELIARGIPEDRIVLDYAGFDTYDSMIRAQKVFGLKSFIVVSQHFHNARAVFIARRNGIDAYGYNAGDASATAGIKTHLREYVARVKAYLEVMIGVEPTFLGKKENIP